MNTQKKKKYKDLLRKETGSMGTLVCSGILLALLAAGTFSADITHNITVRTELQNATDAAALAGAADLVDPNKAGMASYDALQIAASNTADGTAVSQTAPNTTVSVNIDTNVLGEKGTCQVTASKRINNWLACIFGHNFDTITVKSTAAASETINGVAGNMLFPLALSIDAVPTLGGGGGGGNGKGNGNGNTTTQGTALKDLKPGDKVSIYINSQQVKNAAFTSFTIKETNANWLNSAIDQSLSLSAPQTNFIPPVKIGELIFLDNGVAGQKTLAQEPRLTALRDKGDIILPVIEGTPPYNQSRPVIGWVIVKVESVIVNQSGGEVETINGTISTAAIRGTKGQILGGGTPSTNQALQSFSPSQVRLVANP